jgi:hypothetical protein
MMQQHSEPRSLISYCYRGAECELALVGAEGVQLVSSERVGHAPSVYWPCAVPG